MARLTLFGPFSLTGPQGTPCDIPGAKPRALIALLALAPDGALPAESLMAGLWSDRPETQARDSLKHAVADLRKRLGAAGLNLITTDRDHMRLNLVALDIDARKFLALTRSDDAVLIAQGLDLFRGDLLEGLSIRDPGFEDWLRQERQRLRTLAETVAARLLFIAERSSDATAIAAAANRMLQLDPLHEPATRALMQLHAGRGERNVALRLFADLKDGLRRDLDVDPDPVTLALAQSIRDTAPATRAPDPAPKNLPLPDRPSLAVLAFRNLGGDPELDYFAHGIAEDIIIALSHYRWFFVIARNSSFAYQRQTSSLRDIARDLGVRYILDGSVRKAGSRVRVTGELIEPETGIQIWADSYDRDLADIFALQDELTRRVVGAIEPEILRGESQRAQSKTAINLDAYDLHMRGVWHHNKQDQPEDFAEAIHCQRCAIALDPSLARAHVILSRALYSRAFDGFCDDLDRDRRDLFQAATRAVSLEERDAYAHYAMCLAHLMDQQPAAAVIAAERATELAPNLALAQNALGFARIFICRFADAIEPIATAMRLSPRDPATYFFNCTIGLAKYHLGNYETAAHHAQRALSARPRYFSMLVMLACLGQLARTTEARALLPQAEASRPKDAARYWQLLFPYADPALRAHLAEGLRLAGFQP